MKKHTQLPIPAKRVMHQVGSDMRDARLRRRLSMALIAERAGISRATLRKIENGDTSVSLGSFVFVLFALGMIWFLLDGKTTPFLRCLGERSKVILR